MRCRALISAACLFAALPGAVLAAGFDKDLDGEEAPTVTPAPTPPPRTAAPEPVQGVFMGIH